MLEANSIERAARGRALLESLAGGSVRHRATSHEDATKRLKDSLRAHQAGEEDETPDGPGGRPSSGLPPEVNEALVLNHLARHYRGWVDEQIPALDGKTPRQAAQSTGVEPQLRRSPPEGPRRRDPPLRYSSDEVYYLPGAIEISQLRRMQKLERIPDGRAVLRRFMVRGHWRRAASSWPDQRMRWVRPHWKGPDMATIIERTYKLTP